MMGGEAAFLFFFFYDLRVRSSKKAQDGRIEETAAVEIKGSARSHRQVPTGLEES